MSARADSSAEGRWYEGDLHAHSTHSDGDSPVADVIANAEQAGLDFFVITDHDTDMEGTSWFVYRRRTMGTRYSTRHGDR